MKGRVNTAGFVEVYSMCISSSSPYLRGTVSETPQEMVETSYNTKTYTLMVFWLNEVPVTLWS
jgi:hypothetical protein